MKRSSMVRGVAGLAGGAALVAVGLGVASVGVLGGCAGLHGKHTSEHVSLAKEKVNAIKSATEWQMAQQSFLAGDFAKAEKSINRSLDLNPNVTKSHVLKGRIALEQGDLEQAIKSFQTAEALDPQNVDAQYYQGIAAERLQKTDEAIAFYRKAQELDPANAQYPMAAAEMMIGAGRLDEAEEFLAAARLALPNNAGLTQTLGHVAVLREQPEKAIELFAQARLLSPEDDSIAQDLAEAQMTAGRFAEAELLLARMINKPEMAPRRDLKMMRARCLVEIDRLLDAREVLVAVTQDSEGQGDPSAWTELGNVAFKLRDTRRAREAAARVVALAPDRQEGYVLRALVARRENRLSAALQDVNRALEIAPTADQYVLKGLIEQDLGQTNRARESFESALALNPQHDQAQTLLNAVGGRMATVPNE